MEVSLENTGGLERRLQIAVPEDQITPRIQSRLENLSKTTRVQGFRPGKVPLKVIKNRYGAQVRQEVVNQVVQDTLQEAIVKEKLRPAGMPTIDPINSDHGEGVSYTATFEVYPELELASFDTIEIERPTANITDSDIDKMIGVLQKQNSRLEICDRKAAEKDVLLVDFEGKIDGETFDGGSATNFHVEIGSQRLIDGFEEGLIGAGAGETTELDLKFPEDYQQAELAGKPVRFTVTVKEVKEVKLPELDEEFFKQFGVTSGGLEAFKKEVRSNMEREAQNGCKTRVRDAILDKLFEHNQFDVPKVMLDAEINRLREEMLEKIKSQGMDASMLDKVESSHFEEQARKRVSLQLILSEIIKMNDMKADPNKVRTMIETQARSYEDPGAIINWYYADKSRLAEVEALALEDEVIDWILGKCKVKDVEMSFDEIMNTGQTGTA